MREVFFRAWRRHLEGQAPAGIERLIVDVALGHPERFIGHDYPPEQGDDNPFLHLGMHLAIAEQFSIEQPAGILAHYRRPLRARPDEHRAQYRTMRCLGGWLSHVGRDGTAPAERKYLGGLAGLASHFPDRT